MAFTPQLKLESTYLSSAPPDVRNCMALFEGSQVLPACPDMNKMKV